MSTGLAERLDNIKDTVTISCSKVVYLNSRILLDLVDSLYMSNCKVYYMDVISHTCSIRCVVIIAKYANALKLSDCNLCNIWKKVVRNTLWILSDKSALMSSDWVEVTEKNYIPLWICCVEVCENLLDHPLCPAIWVRRCSLWALLRDRDKCRIAVYCS